MENNKQENKTENEKKIDPNSSAIVKTKEPDFSKEVVIDRLLADKQVIDDYFNNMKKEFGDKLSDLDIQKRIHNMVVRDNIFNAGMKILSPCYQIKINPTDLNNVITSFVNANPNLGKAPYEYVKKLASQLLAKEMLFTIIAKEWKISVDDEELKAALDRYYKETNHPIRDILNDKTKMEKMRKTMLNEKIINAICSKVKYKMDTEAIKKNAEESRKAMEEALAKAQANTKIEDKTNSQNKK